MFSVYGVEVMDADNTVIVEVVLCGKREYCGNVWCDGVMIEDIPRNVSYEQLTAAVEQATGYTLPPRKQLRFKIRADWKRCYAYASTNAAVVLTSVGVTEYLYQTRKKRGLENVYINRG